ncbi:uncharacterized protein [Drosophila kikkawai]|uniref:Uncharacterized protein n=1 Tax=Drosophila kikkawai TaxID=30033 RepID=A0ABM4GHV6_DROKI
MLRLIPVGAGSPVDVFDWGSGTNTASTISADEDEASRDGRQSDASRPSSTGPADDASASTISADEDETSQDSDWSNAPRSPPPRWTPPSTTPLQSWAPATTSRSRPPPPSYAEIFGLGPYPDPHITARCAAVTTSRDSRPRLPTIAELAAEEARRRAEDLSEELGTPQMAQLPVGNPSFAQPPSNGPPPSPTPRRRARRRSAPWADSPSSSSDESSLGTDEGALDHPRWVPAPVEWTTPNGTLPAALLRRIHGRAEDLSDELGSSSAGPVQPINPEPRSARDRPPTPAPARRGRRRSAPWADSPSESSSEEELPRDRQGHTRWVPSPDGWVPIPDGWSTPNGTLPAGLIIRIQQRLQVARRRTRRYLEEEQGQRFRVQLNRDDHVRVFLHPTRK